MKRIWNRIKECLKEKWNWCGGDYFDSRCIDRLVIIFKAQLTELVQTIFSKITSESGKI